MEDKPVIYLPVIATRGVVVFPLFETSLEIGRKKSVIAVDIANSSSEEKFIIIASQNNPEVNDPGLEDISKYGTLCKITALRKNPDKSYRVTLTGVSRVAINSYYNTDGTIYAEAYGVEDLVVDAATSKALFDVLINNLKKFTSSTYTSVANFATKYFNSGMSINGISDYCANALPFNMKAKVDLIQELDPSKRIQIIIDKINEEEISKQIEEDLNKKLKDKFDNTQKEYYLREKIKAIKEELGDDNSESDPESILDTIEKNPYPENVKNKIKDELKKLEMMQPSSPEAAVIRSYVDWLVKTPWYQSTTDLEDINEVEKVLNEDHYGLEKPKERIVEYLAVKKLTSSLKAPIICFSGPPGTGKTSLALSIARALGRKLVKVSLGGVSDEAEIRGHRRTYIGAMPGKIIQGMKKAGVNNPVFILDEIDKLGKDYKGDPSNALLDVLDPEQNKAFADNYLEEPYDLSNVLFIATANYLENVPAPLLDRLEIIELSSYTEQEKLEIAKQYLIKKQIAQNGINELSFDDDALLSIIRGYTREAGVRQLERCIGSIARKVAVKSLKDSNIDRHITVELVKEYLGKESFDFTRKSKEDQIGLVTGLAYTQYGGDILPIEAVYFEGKGNLIITGNLGKVMSESASIALGHVKANAEKYGIDPKIFEKVDIHIHCPEGAVPKDGPSAGVTLTTALVSCLSKKTVKSDIAMTGEITLRGEVLPIGGLREKSIAAHRSGIKTIYIPFGNEKNIEDIPESVRKELNIVLVKEISEIIDNVINK